MESSRLVRLVGPGGYGSRSGPRRPEVMPLGKSVGAYGILGSDSRIERIWSAKVTGSIEMTCEER